MLIVCFLQFLFDFICFILFLFWSLCVVIIAVSFRTNSFLILFAAFMEEGVPGEALSSSFSDSGGVARLQTEDRLPAAESLRHQDPGFSQRPVRPQEVETLIHSAP